MTTLVIAPVSVPHENLRQAEAVGRCGARLAYFRDDFLWGPLVPVAQLQRLERLRGDFHADLHRRLRYLYPPVAESWRLYAEGGARHRPALSTFERFEIWGTPIAQEIANMAFVLLDLTRQGIALDRVGVRLFETVEVICPNDRAKFHAVTARDLDQATQFWERLAGDETGEGSDLTDWYRRALAERCAQMVPDENGFVAAERDLMVQIGPEWRGLSRVIGEAMVAQFERRAGWDDSILLFHAERLQHSGLVEIRGAAQGMRDREIRRID